MALKLPRHPTVRVAFHQLDPCDQESIRAFRHDLTERFEYVDVLINNASQQLLVRVPCFIKTISRLNSRTTTIASQ